MAAFLALGFLFIVLPTMVLGAIAYCFLPKLPGRSLGNSKAVERTGNTTIIDANYRVTNDHSEETETTISGASA